MNAKEYSYDQDPMREKDNALDMQDPYEEEETLSFCDLPIYSDSAEWENSSKEDQISSSSSSSSSSSANQDFFEFFSGELSSTNSSSTYPPFENIVFCGKLIPSKEPVSDTAADESKKQPKPRKRGFFRWNLKLFRRRRTSKPTVRKSKTNPNQAKLRYVSSSKSLSLPASESPANKATAAKGGEKYGFSVRRVPILASPTKSRWHLLMFGLTRLPPAEMELSDIRSRQCRRSPSALFPPPLRSDCDEKASRGKGLWGLIRALGCGGHRPLDLHPGNAPVVA